MYNLRYENYEAFATIPNAFAPHELEIIRNLIEKHKTASAVVGDDNITNKEIRDSRIRWLMDNDYVHHWIFQRIATLVNEVNPKYFGIDLTSCESIQLTEYDSEYAGFYGAHVDSGYGHNSARYRKLSITMQLSRPDEYEGGDLQLYHESINKPVTASREYGAMTLFRSHIIHEVLPVTKGKRFSFVTWVHGPLYK